VRRFGAICLTLALAALVACDSETPSAETGVTSATGPTEATPPTGPTGTESGATGEESGPTGETAPAGEALVAGELEAGTYSFDGFAEPITFTVGEGWEAFIGEPQAGDTVLGVFFALLHADHPAANVAFLTSSRVLDPGLAWNEEGSLVPAPEDLIAWFAEHPYHDADEPIDTTLAGRPARSVELTVVRRPRPGWPPCGGQCVVWMPIGVDNENGPVTEDDLMFAGAIDERDRMIVVEVGGEQLLIDIGAFDRESFDAFVPLAEEVLATLAIGSTV
jgi:hypothetical protein